MDFLILYQENIKENTRSKYQISQYHVKKAILLFICSKYDIDNYEQMKETDFVINIASHTAT